jgi:hypothetical protein
VQLAVSPSSIEHAALVICCAKLQHQPTPCTQVAGLGAQMVLTPHLLSAVQQASIHKQDTV